MSLTPPSPTLDDLERSARAAEPPPEQPDEKVDQWKERVEREEGLARVRGLHQDIEHRERYALWLFLVLCVWLAAILLMMFFQGFSFCEFSLPESTVVAALGTTTINVIALFVIVAKYIFPKR